MKNQARPHTGFSLVELLIAVTILAIVIMGVTIVGDASDRAYRTGATVAQLEAQAATATQRIVTELSTAGIDTFVTPPVPGAPSTQLDYLKAIGFDGTQVEWTAPRRLELELEIGETDDGVDNNGNGLVDERRLVLTENLGLADERRLVVTRWVSELAVGEQPNGVDDNGNGLVDEPGFSVERNGETFVVRLSLQRLDAGGRLLSRSTSTSTRIRNRDRLGEGS